MAVWVPKYETKFIGPLVKNLLQYIRTNQADALLWANGSALPSFASIYNSTAGFQQETFPNLGVLTMRSSLSEDEDASGVMEHHRVRLFVEVEGSSATNARDLLEPYMLAVDSMCRKIPKATLMAGMTGTQHGDADVSEHDYGIVKIRSADGTSGVFKYPLMGQMTFEVMINEKRLN